MPVPATTGQLRKHVKDMKIGDYIVWSYHPDDYFEFGADTPRYTECPLEGIPNGETSKGKYWYGIKADKGLLISDRVLRNEWSWNTLNNYKFIEGISMTISTVQGILRSPTGGVAYADANGNKSLTDQGYGGWPTNNEWDKYIVKSSLEGTITAGDDAVWHWNKMFSWCQETPVNGLIYRTTTATNTNRIRRGYGEDMANPARLSFGPSSQADVSVGFRPVFEYKE